MYKKKLFFIGIHGIGMSALAMYAKKHKYFVSGIDKNYHQEISNMLKKNDIFSTLEDETCPSVLLGYDTIIISNAIQKNNIFYLFALQNNIPIILRGQLLSDLLQNKKMIAITGSHGKTTTTSIIGDICIKTNQNPTIFVGGIMKEYQTNIIDYNKQLAIVEADDAYKSFLSLNPSIAIITSISLEHLETYTDINNIINTFISFALKTHPSGYIIINTDSDATRKAIKILQKYRYKKIITYGFHESSNYKITVNEEKNNFTITQGTYIVGTFQTPLFGKANIQNTTAAIISLSILKISLKRIKTALKSFQGIERRFEHIGTYQNKITIYDDYGHHPNEIQAVFQIIHQKGRRAIIFFQPHKYIRTKALWNEFINVFVNNQISIEMLYITDIYAVGENYDNIYNSQNLVLEIKKYFTQVIYLAFDKNFILFKEHIKQQNYSNSTIFFLTLGAGVMNQWAKKLTTL